MGDDGIGKNGKRHMKGTRQGIIVILGLFTYWAWVYLSFNTTSSMNWSASTNPTLLWVHLASMILGVLTYLLMIGFSRRTSLLLASRRLFVGAGFLMALGTAFYALPVFSELSLLQVVGGALTGIVSPWIVIYWGTLCSKLEPHRIVLYTALSFLAANIVYIGVSFLPGLVDECLLVILPIGSVLLFPRSMKIEFGSGMFINGGSSRPYRIFPVSNLPWNIGIGLFVVMTVYGGVRVFLGMLNTQGGADWWATTLAICAVTLVFVLWGLFFQGKDASLGTVYKVALPLLATTLLLIVIFGQEFASYLSLLATACNVTIEILTWMLLADLARTTKTPVFLVFAVGRMAVQGGMAAGQLLGWFFLPYMAAFAIVSIFALMLVMGFMFKDEDTLMVFEAPTRHELESISVGSGESVEEHLRAIANHQGLSPRETEIFIYWATGHGSRYIQDKLVISSATVKTHVRHIYEKCDVHSRAEIISLLEETSGSRIG